MVSGMEKLGITIKNKQMVKPAEPTWEGRIPLSEWDQTGMVTHVPTIYFYKPSHDWQTPPNKITTTLIHSLSHVLVYFYPLAGRLTRIGKGRLQLDCNSEGVQFIEAESGTKIEDFGELFHPLPEFKYLIPQVDYKTPIHEQPLYLVQVTKFKCGGISIGMAISHVATDGQSALHFIQEWTKIARGEGLGAKPFLDRKVLRAGEPPVSSPSFDHTEFDDPPRLIGQKSDEDQKKKETKSQFFKLTKNQVDALKKSANEGQAAVNCRPYSRYEAITAHLWKCASKARGLDDEQPTTLFFCVDTRNRLKPPLPERYFGNAIMDVAATSNAGDLVKRPLSYASSIMREAIAKVTHEYANSSIDFLKKQDDLSIFQNVHYMESSEDQGAGAFYGNPNLSVLSWLTLPSNGWDFGWGKEIYMGPGKNDPEDGESLLMSGQQGDHGSVVVALCLQVDHMNAFKNIFYQDIEIEG